MSAADYAIRLYSPDGGTEVANLTRFVRLAYANRVDGDPGRIEIEIPADYITSTNYDYLACSHRVVVWRRAQDSSKWGIDFAGLIRGVEVYQRGQRTYLSLSGFNYNYLLSNAIVEAAKESADAAIDDYADDAIKGIVRKQLGATATDTDRDLTSLGFTVEADLSLGTNVKLDVARRNVLDACQDIAEASKATPATAVYFGYRATGNGTTAELRTRVGAWGGDVSDRVTFSVELGNAKNARYTVDRSDEITSVYGAGAGVAAYRIEATGVEDARLSDSVLNRRESFYDVRSETDTNKITAGMNALLKEGRPVRTLTFDTLDTAACRYWVHYGLGYVVRGEFAGIIRKFHVAGVLVTVQEGQDAISLSLEEINDD